MKARSVHPLMGRGTSPFHEEKKSIHQICTHPNYIIKRIINKLAASYYFLKGRGSTTTSNNSKSLEGIVRDWAANAINLFVELSQGIRTQWILA